MLGILRKKAPLVDVYIRYHGLQLRGLPYNLGRRGKGAYN